MKICILSDSHDQTNLLDAAVAEAKTLGAEAVLHCGDVVEPSTLQCLIKYGIPVHFIHGNNTGDLTRVNIITENSNGILHYYGKDARLELAGKRIFLVHFPHYAEAMAVGSGDWDLVCCGHYHRTSIEQLINMHGYPTYVVNPGTVGGLGSHATYIMGDLESMDFSIRYLDKP